MGACRGLLKILHESAGSTNYWYPDHGLVGITSCYYCSVPRFCISMHSPPSAGHGILAWLSDSTNSLDTVEAQHIRKQMFTSGCTTCRRSSSWRSRSALYHTSFEEHHFVIRFQQAASVLYGQDAVMIIRQLNYSCCAKSTNQSSTAGCGIIKITCIAWIRYCFMQAAFRTHDSLV